MRSQSLYLNPSESKNRDLTVSTLFSFSNRECDLNLVVKTDRIYNVHIDYFQGDWDMALELIIRDVRLRHYGYYLGSGACIRRIYPVRTEVIEHCSGFRGQFIEDNGDKIKAFQERVSEILHRRSTINFGFAERSSAIILAFVEFLGEIVETDAVLIGNGTDAPETAEVSEEKTNEVKNMNDESRRKVSEGMKASWARRKAAQAQSQGTMPRARMEDSVIGMLQQQTAIMRSLSARLDRIEAKPLRGSNAKPEALSAKPAEKPMPAQNCIILVREMAGNNYVPKSSWSFRVYGGSSRLLAKVCAKKCIQRFGRKYVKPIGKMHRFLK